MNSNSNMTLWALLLASAALGALPAYATNATDTRTVVCRDNNGNQVGDSLCSGSKPDTTRVGATCSAVLVPVTGGTCIGGSAIASASGQQGQTMATAVPGYEPSMSNATAISNITPSSCQSMGGNCFEETQTLVYEPSLKFEHRTLTRTCYKNATSIQNTNGASGLAQCNWIPWSTASGGKPSVNESEWDCASAAATQ